MRFAFTIFCSGLLGVITSINGYGWFASGTLNPAGIFVNLLGVGVIVTLSHAMFKER